MASLLLQDTLYLSFYSYCFAGKQTLTVSIQLFLQLRYIQFRGLSDVKQPHFCSASFAATKGFKLIRHRLFDLDLAIQTATVRQRRVGCGGEGRCMDVTLQLL